MGGCARTHGQFPCIVSRCLETGVGLGGANFRRLQHMAALISSSKVPFLAIRNWNELPQALVNIKWVQFLHAAVVQPADISYTCRSGQGRILDYAVVSTALIPFF